METKLTGACAAASTASAERRRQRGVDDNCDSTKVATPPKTWQVCRLQCSKPLKMVGRDIT
eukprot:scaffold6555_cov60-Phaeocystis_antarctica.AAC.1